jgi:uncharacterized alkaline shock family protein YloU
MADRKKSKISPISDESADVEAAVFSALETIIAETPGVDESELKGGGIGLIAREKVQRGIRLSEDEKDCYTVDLYLTAEYGTTITETAWDMQKIVTERLKKNFGVGVGSVNIHIQGVTF